MLKLALSSVILRGPKAFTLALASNIFTYVGSLSLFPVTSAARVYLSFLGPVMLLVTRSVVLAYACLPVPPGYGRICFLGLAPDFRIRVPRSAIFALPSSCNLSALVPEKAK